MASHPNLDTNARLEDLLSQLENCRGVRERRELNTSLGDNPTIDEMLATLPTDRDPDLQTWDRIDAVLVYLRRRINEGDMSSALLLMWELALLCKDVQKQVNRAIQMEDDEDKWVPVLAEAKRLRSQFPFESDAWLNRQLRDYLDVQCSETTMRNRIRLWKKLELLLPKKSKK